MLHKDFDVYIKEISEDIEGLQQLVNRIKARNENIQNTSLIYQEFDVESVNRYTTMISETISQLENCLLRGKNNVK